MVDLEKIKERNDLVLIESNDNGFGAIRMIPFGDKYFLFNAKDCALVLEYKNTALAVRKFVPVMLKIKLKPKNFGQSDSLCPKINNAGELFITEEGLYRLISSSKMPKAEEFKSWLFGEMLPTFKKTGKYDTEDFKKSKYYSTIKALPGWDEDVAFKQSTIRTTSEIARSKHLLKSTVWNEFVRLFNDVYNVNLNLKITNFMKKNNIKKRPTVREYLDYKKLHMKAYVVFEMVRYGESLRDDPKLIAIAKVIAYGYYNHLNYEEKITVNTIIKEMHRNGAIGNLDDDDPALAESVA